jgi:hypothetical protein
MIHAVNNPLQTHRISAGPPAPNPASSPESSSRLTPEDGVTLSPAALRYDDDPAMDAKIAEIRKQIANDEYLTDEKIDAVVNRLHKALSAEHQPLPKSFRKLA